MRSAGKRMTGAEVDVWGVRRLTESGAQLVEVLPAEECSTRWTVALCARACNAGS